MGDKYIVKSISETYDDLQKAWSPQAREAALAKRRFNVGDHVAVNDYQGTHHGTVVETHKNGDVSVKYHKTGKVGREKHPDTIRLVKKNESSGGAGDFKNKVVEGLMDKLKQNPHDAEARMMMERYKNYIRKEKGIHIDIDKAWSPQAREAAILARKRLMDKLAEVNREDTKKNDSKISVGSIRGRVGVAVVGKNHTYDVVTQKGTHDYHGISFQAEPDKSGMHKIHHSSGVASTDKKKLSSEELHEALTKLHNKYKEDYGK